LIALGRPFLKAFIAAQIALLQVLAGISFGFTANCAALAEPDSSLSGSRILREKVTGFPADIHRIKAPPLEGGVGFLNTDKPITLKGLAGRFVILDFWTFCCINCMHILPKLAELEQKYSDRLTVVGIHSAKFENEKDTSNISKAILRYGIKHPVINDANFKIWDTYGVHAWPTLVLIDPEGYVVGVYSGEGHTPEIAALIDRLSPWYSAQGSLTKGELVGKPEKQSTTELSFPGKVALDQVHRKLLVISDTGHNRIVVARLDDGGKTATVENIIGDGEGAFKDGSFAKASFNHPQGVCCAASWIWVADTLNNAIRLIFLDQNKVTTLSGIGRQAGSGARGGPAKTTALNSPWDLAIRSGKILIAMAGSHQIWISDLPEMPEISPYAGSGREDIIDGPAHKAAFAQPSGITFGDKLLFVADAEDSGIRQIDPGIGESGVQVTTLIGKGLFVFGDVDGPIASARLQHPLGICADGDKLYIADSYNHKIKCLDLKAKTIATVAGSGKSGYRDGAQAQFAEPGGLAMGNGKIYVADTNNSVIRVITLPTAPGGSSLTDTLKLSWPR
jgi:thiol-disulfide isomerase/thioredoxin